MNKMFAVGIAAVIAALFIGGAYAAGQWGAQDRGAFHEQMEEIMETGTYDDLVALREETGRPLKRWVTDAETFAQAQERHAQMEAQYGEGPHHGKMGGRGQGRGGQGGCRMQ